MRAAAVASEGGTDRGEEEHAGRVGFGSDMVRERNEIGIGQESIGETGVGVVGVGMIVK